MFEKCWHKGNYRGRRKPKTSVGEVGDISQEREGKFLERSFLGELGLLLLPDFEKKNRGPGGFQTQHQSYVWRGGFMEKC